jgi:hypothetical protein
MISNKYQKWYLAWYPDLISIFFRHLPNTGILLQHPWNWATHHNKKLGAWLVNLIVYRIVLWHNSLAGGVLGADHQLIFLCNLKNTGGIVIHGSLNEATHGSMDHPLMMHSLFACQMLRRTKLMKGILSWQAHRYASKQAQVKLWQCSAKLWLAKVANPACVQTSNQWGIPLAARTSSKLGSSCLQMFN